MNESLAFCFVANFNTKCAAEKRKKGGIKRKLMSVNFIGLAFREWPHLAHSHSAKPTFFPNENLGVNRDPLDKV